MMRTRQGSKRALLNSSDSNALPSVSKKAKHQRETSSKYFEEKKEPKDGSSTFSETQIEAINISTHNSDSNDSSIGLNKLSKAKVLKIEDESDSDGSSSDGFVKAPFSLNDLGEFETLGNKSNKAAKEEQSMLMCKSKAVCNLSDDSENESQETKQEYYDFSQILQSQKLIEDTKNELSHKQNDSKDVYLKKSKSKNDLKSSVKKRKKEPKPKFSNEEELNITELLAIAEGSSAGFNVKDRLTLKAESDCEAKNADETQYSVPEKGVEVTIELPNVKQKRKSKGFDIEAAMKRRINLIRKENQVLIHKVHLLCWIAHCRNLNRSINNDDLLGLALSLIPSKHCYPPKHADLNYLEQLVEWFVHKVIVDENHKLALNSSKLPSLQVLEIQLNLKLAFSVKYLVLMFVCMLRALGLSARLVVSLRVAPLRPPASDLCSLSNKPKEETFKSDKTISKSKSQSSAKSRFSAETDVPATTPQNKTILKGKSIVAGKKSNSNSKTKKETLTPSSSVNRKQSGSKDKNKLNDGLKSQYFSSSDELPLKNMLNKVSKNKNSKACKTTPKGSGHQANSPYFKSNAKLKTETNMSVSNTDAVSSLTSSRSKRSSNKKSYVIESCSSSDSDADNFETPSSRQRKKNVKSSVSSDLTQKKPKNTKCSDEDFKSPKPSNSKNKTKDRRVLSSDEESGNKEKKIGSDFWIEVFLEAEEKWISVDLKKGKVHCIQQLYSGATQPVRYVLACNNDGTLKDVTRRYAPQWLTVTRRQRIDDGWWKETILPYLPHKSAREREEDEDLDRQMHDKPLPSSVTEYKNHPLFALKRHLLKFEAIYPPDAPTLGFVRGEPVYSRGCVTELHTRETWIKEAKLVRRGEEPYKIVKARPKWDKLSQTVINDLPLPLFGHWQVEDYIPPPAVDGKVPRNEYGNVEMYKPCMLPPGTVHLQVPQLARVARKLGIDCAPAVVGWEFSGGGSHPVLDGFIVCEEFKDVLLDAWDKEMDESAKRAKEKVEQRVYGNWKRLIRGLLIRERLKLRYDFGLPEPEKKKKKQNPKPGSSKS